MPEESLEAAAFDITPEKDGGVLKTILRQGEGDATPPKGSKVKVYYKGTLDENGEEFDSNTSGDGFEFQLGKGMVIKGWDVGVASMKKGEKALFKIRSEYAYGDSGSPPKIPEKATLNFEVELLSWVEGEDITENKDEGIMKISKVDGEGWKKPKDGTKVKISYVLSLATGEEIQRKGDFEFTVGEEEVHDTLEQCVTNLKKGEQAVFRVQPSYGYGEKGNEELKVPANAALVYDITLTDFTPERESYEMETAEKLSFSRQKKEEGNDFYKQKRYNMALKRYKKALDCIRYDSAFDDDQKNISKEVKLSCYLNQAAVSMQLRDWKAVLEATNEALKLEKDNVKGLYRRGVANTELDNWEEASNDLKRALELVPQDKQVLQAKKRLLAKKKRQQQKDKKIFGGMFGKIRLVEETVPEKTEGEDTEESTGSQKTDSDKAEGTVPMEVEKTEA